MTESTEDAVRRRRARPLMKHAAVDPDFEAHPPREAQTTVGVQVVFLKLGDIDTAAEFFQATVFVQSRWLEPLLDDPEQAGELVELEHGEEYWNPGVFVENVLAGAEEKTWQVTSYDQKGQATVCERKLIKARFYENMELNEYPFDSQDLTVTVTSSRATDDVILVQDEEQNSCLICEDGFKDAQEWDVFNHIHVRIYNPVRRIKGSRIMDGYESTSPMKYKMNNIDKFRFPRPRLSVSCKAMRRWKYFAWNVFVLMTLLGGLIFTTFSVPAHLTQNRLQISFVLLLSNITFKLAVSKNTPHISYLTSLDLYIILSLIHMSLVCVWHAVAAHLPDDHRTWADRVALGLLVTSYVLVNTTYFVYNVVRVTKRKKKFSKREREEIVTLPDEALQLDSTTGSQLVYMHV